MLVVFKHLQFKVQLQGIFGRKTKDPARFTNSSLDEGDWEDEDCEAIDCDMLDEEADEAADAVDDDEDASRTSSDENCNDEWTDEEFAPPIFVLDPLQEPQNDSWLRAKSGRPTSTYSSDERILCQRYASNPMAKTYAGATDLKELKIKGKA